MQYSTILLLVVFFAIVYFMLIRPQQKRQKQTQDMQKNLKKGDRVVTIGGLHGSVEAIDEDHVILRCTDGSKLTYDRAAVRTVLASESQNKDSEE